jgi:hypothetical protein
VRQVTLVTTLLDPQLYPAQEILQAYLRRWRLEMCLDDLKTTLEMEMLRSRSPEMVQREVYAHLIAHNLIRYTMAQAATEQTVPLARISFKGTLNALRQFTHAMSQARTQKKRRQLWTQLLATLAADLVPERPDRREPRAVKRVKKKYPRLIVPRHQYRDLPNAMFAAPRPGCAGWALCKGHSPERVASGPRSGSCRRPTLGPEESCHPPRACWPEK